MTCFGRHTSAAHHAVLNWPGWTLDPSFSSSLPLWFCVQMWLSSTPYCQWDKSHFFFHHHVKKKNDVCDVIPIPQMWKSTSFKLWFRISRGFWKLFIKCENIRFKSILISCFKFFAMKGRVQMFLICYRSSQQVLDGNQYNNLFVEKIVKLKGNWHCLARILNVNKLSRIFRLSCRDT